MSMKVVPKDELVNQVGEKWTSDIWVTLDQPRINQFADVTEDHQFIHVDEDKAAQTPFGGTIAHGFLTLSLLPRLCEGNGVMPEKVLMGLNYGFDKVRFLAPVKAGRRVRAHGEIIGVEAKEGNRFLIRQQISVEIEGEETPALVAEWLTMVVAG